MICIFPGKLCDVRNHTRSANEVKEMPVPQFAIFSLGKCESKKSARIFRKRWWGTQKPSPSALCVPMLALPLTEQYHIKKQILRSNFFINIYSNNFDGDIRGKTDNTKDISGCGIGTTG